MKFKVGDILIDKLKGGDETVWNAVVLDVMEVYGEAYYYTLQYSNGEVDEVDQKVAEFVWMVAPKGSVAWLIHQLSMLPQLAPVNYLQWNDYAIDYNRELVDNVRYDDDWEAVELW